MSIKHPRPESSHDAVNEDEEMLQRSVKRVKIDDAVNCSSQSSVASASTSDLSGTTDTQDSDEAKLFNMNQLLRGLHFLRIARKGLRGNCS